MFSGEITSVNSDQTVLGALYKHSTRRYVEAPSWSDFHRISATPAELMEGSQIWLENKIESRKQEGEEEKNRTHAILPSTFQNT